jgi:peroxiredoxin
MGGKKRDFPGARRIIPPMFRPFRFAAAVLLGSALSTHAADPMTFQELSLRLRGGDSPQVLLQETAQRKLLQPLTPDQEKALKGAGASEEWIAALESPALAVSPETAAAFQARKNQQRQQQQAAAAAAQATPVPGTAVSQDRAHDADIILVGDHAPAFQAKTTSGEMVSLTEPARKLTLLTIVSPKSQACLDELTILQRALQAKLAAAGATIIALGSGFTTDEMAAMGRELGLTFTLAEDPRKEITALFAKDFIPRCYVIDQRGIVKFSSIGLNKQDLVRMVNVIQSDLR